jgi:hypothetical protein
MQHQGKASLTLVDEHLRPYEEPLCGSPTRGSILALAVPQVDGHPAGTKVGPDRSNMCARSALYHKANLLPAGSQ